MTSTQILDELRTAPSEDDNSYRRNLKEICEQLTTKHKFILSKDDLDGIESIYRKFYLFGPFITYLSSRGGAAQHANPSYADLMREGEGPFTPSFLSSEESFETVKDLEEKNLVVPLVGDFAGPKTIRAIGKYLKDRRAVVSAFYTSNVESYIDDVLDDFCLNVACLPLTEKSTFIRWTAGGKGGKPSLGSMAAFARGCGN